MTINLNHVNIQLDTSENERNRTNWVGFGVVWISFGSRVSLRTAPVAVELGMRQLV
jgi:hypothetical protein